MPVGVRRAVRPRAAQEPAQRRGRRRPLPRDGAARSAREAHRAVRRRGLIGETPCTSCTSPSSRCRRIPRTRGASAGATALMFSNRHFDPVAGSRLYNEYLEHYRLAEEVGFDGIMLNEHHNAPFCMQAKCNVFASILAAMTKRVKIVLLGNPLPLADNPVRLAEELAMIDMVSRGPARLRLRAGRRPGAARHRGEPRLQPRALRGGPRADRAGVDAGGPVPLGGHPLPAPGGEPVGGAAAEAAPAHLDPRRAQQGDDHLGGAAALSVHRAQHRDRGDQEDLGALRLGRRGGRLHQRAGEPRVSPARATWPRPRRRRSPTRGSSCGCRASSPAWPTRCGRARRATSRRPTARPSSSTRWAAARTRGPPASRTRSAISRSSRARRRRCSPSSAASSRRRGPSILGLWASDGFVSNADATDLHPAARAGGAPGGARDGQGARALEPVRGQRPGRHQPAGPAGAPQRGLSPSARAGPAPG